MSAKRALNNAFETAMKTGIERAELQGVTPGSEAERLMQEARLIEEALKIEPALRIPESALMIPEPALVSDSFAFLDSPQMPESFVHSPRQVRQNAAASQMNIRVSNEGRFHMDSYLMELKRAGRPVYMFEVVDVLLKELRDPEFRARVTAMLEAEQA